MTRRSPINEPQRFMVTAKIGDKMRTGWYFTESGMITVGNINGQKTTQLGNSATAPEGLARMMMSELDWES